MVQRFTQAAPEGHVDELIWLEWVQPDKERNTLGFLETFDELFAWSVSPLPVTLPSSSPRYLSSHSIRQRGGGHCCFRFFGPTAQFVGS